MGHLIHEKDEVYRVLAERLNREPVGAPINDTLMAILQRLYTESEALVGSQFPLVPIRLEQIAAAVGMSPEEIKPVLEGMADKGLVIDMPRRDTSFYMLAPMVIGFFEYTFMRARDEIAMKELAELFNSYFKNPEAIEELSGIDTRMMRTLVYERLIPAAVETEVLTYERASQVIREAGGGALSMCACRHKAMHLGKACDAPMEVCMSLGSAAEWVIRRGMGKGATVEELLQVLEQTEALGLVHNCDNVMNKPAYICHCCGCCCVIMKNIKEFGKYAVHPTNFLPVLAADSCIGCGICAQRCQIGAIDMYDDSEGNELPLIDAEMCLGCGICASTCPSDALSMARREDVHVPPRTGREKFSRIAREKGKASSA
ncbi:MAG: 4Fe-4S dicluster domain-containing protein [Syntrophomonadaceae bacterium]